MIHDLKIGDKIFCKKNCPINFFGKNNDYEKNLDI